MSERFNFERHSKICKPNEILLCSRCFMYFVFCFTVSLAVGRNHNDRRKKSNRQPTTHMLRKNENLPTIMNLNYWDNMKLYLFYISCSLFFSGWMIWASKMFRNHFDVWFYSFWLVKRNVRLQFTPRLDVLCSRWAHKKWHQSAYFKICAIITAIDDNCHITLCQYVNEE